MVQFFGWFPSLFNMTLGETALQIGVLMVASLYGILLVAEKRYWKNTTLEKELSTTASKENSLIADIEYWKGERKMREAELAGFRK